MFPFFFVPLQPFLEKKIVNVVIYKLLENVRGKENQS